MLKRRFKQLAIIGATLVALLLVVVLMLPTILGTKWIYQPLVDRLAADNFDLTIDSVHLRWFSPLKFERIAIKQADGLGLVSIAEIRSNRGLFGFLIGGRRLGRIEVVRPTVDAQLLADASNLDRLIKAIEGKSTTNTKKDKPRIDVEVALIDASAKVQRENLAEPLVVIPPFDLNIQYLAASGPSRLHVGQTQVLKQVELTPELIELGLGYAVPLMAQSAWFDGKVSLDIGELDIPLDTPIESTGNAVLTLHTVRTGPTQPAVITVLDLIARLRGVESQHELVFVDGSQIEIGMKDAQVTHQGLQVGLPRVDSRLQFESAGSVGLVDKQLALKLQVPMPVEQLARRDQVKELGVPKLTIPIGGTLDEPKVNFEELRNESAALLAVIRSRVADEAPATAAALGALEAAAGGDLDETIAAGVDFVKDLRERRRAAKAAAEAQPTSDSPVEPKRPIIDGVRSLLRGNRKEP
ncbi:MAG: hypothetical protein SFV81_18395 [Pirellulaceae bacterium]|nr:hypothetical protein [Pirellulaceae bacterium]